MTNDGTYRMKQVVLPEYLDQSISHLHIRALLDALGSADPGYYSVRIYPPRQENTELGLEVTAQIDVHPVETEVRYRVELSHDWGVVKVESFKQWVQRRVNKLLGR